MHKCICAKVHIQRNLQGYLAVLLIAPVWKYPKGLVIGCILDTTVEYHAAVKMKEADL